MTHIYCVRVDGEWRWFDSPKADAEIGSVIDATIDATYHIHSDEPADFASGLHEVMRLAFMLEGTPLLTTTDVADKYGLDDSTVRQAVRRGNLKPANEGSKVHTFWIGDVERLWGDKESH